MNLFGALAGLIAGLAVANIRHPREPIGRVGVIGTFLAAAAVALFTPAAATWVDDRVLGTADLVGAAPMVQRLLLIAAVACWSAHLLGLLTAGSRIVQAVVVVAVLATGAMVWQWGTISALPGNPGADPRWYHVAFAAGIGLPQLVVLFFALRHRAPGRHWVTVAAVASAAGVGFSAWMAVLTFAPTALAALPAWSGWALLALAASGYWWASQAARSELPAAGDDGEHPDEDESEPDDADVDTTIETPGGEDPDEAAAAAGAPSGSTDLVALPVQEIEQFDTTDPAEAQRRAAAVAIAFSRQLDDNGHDNGSIAVGVSGDSLILATADGLGYLPHGSGSAPTLVPLINRVPPEFVTKWLGYAHPQMPLLAAAERGYIEPLQAVATINAEGELGGVEIEDADKLELATLSAPRSRTDSVPISEAHEVLAELQTEWSLDDAGTPSSQLAARVVAARWTTTPDGNYPRARVAELVSLAKDDLQAGDADSAQYNLGAARRVPLPELTSTRVSLGTPPPAALDAIYVNETEADAYAEEVPVAPEDRVAPPPLIEQTAADISIIATLADQIGGTTQIAVALASDGTAVYATSDGLGYLPAGARVPLGVVPLASVVDGAFAARWLGCAHPHEALLDAAGRGYIAEDAGIITTSAGTVAPGVRTVTREELDDADRAELATRREDFNTIAISDVNETLDALTAGLGPAAADIGAAWWMAESLRWTDTDDGGAAAQYVLAWIGYLHAEATAAARDGDLGAARYLLGNAALAVHASNNDAPAES